MTTQYVQHGNLYTVFGIRIGHNIMNASYVRASSTFILCSMRNYHNIMNTPYIQHNNPYTVFDMEIGHNIVNKPYFQHSIYLLGGEEVDGESPTGSRTVNRVTRYTVLNFLLYRQRAAVSLIHFVHLQVGVSVACA